MLVVATCSSAAFAQTTPPPDAPVGTIAGQVLDAANGDPIIEAGVEVIGVQKQIRTDLDGRFSVKVPAGTYQVRFFAPLYQGARLEKVVVEPNKVATADVPLHPEGQKSSEPRSRPSRRTARPLPVRVHRRDQHRQNLYA